MNTFILTLRKYLTDNRRRFCLTLAGLVALNLILGSLSACIHQGGGTGQTILMIFYLSIFGCVFASLSFASMKTPRGRISTLMTPAPMLHKFLVRWIVAVPVTALLLWGGFWLTEATRVVLWPVFNESTAVWLDTTAALGHESSLITAVIVSFAMAAQAFYFLGAIVWPRHSFIKSVLAGWVISTVCSIVMVVVDWSVPYHGHILPQVSQLIAWSIFSLNITLAVILYGIAYLRFKESDVADHLI